MVNQGRFVKPTIYLIVFLLAFSAIVASAQEQEKDSKKEQPSAPISKIVMWETVNIAERDLFAGPGGDAMRPDLSSITFIKEEKKGHNKKYRIKDGAGRTWVAKFGREAQPETAAVRIMWALGYKTEVNYLVPTLTIPGKGTFKNVRLEARPEEIDRLDEWKWKDNPFVGTKEFQGLKLMMVFFNNWDIVDVQNKILQVEGASGAKELHYIISDLGATFGKLGNNNFPIVYRIGRKTNNPTRYIDSGFIDDVEDGKLHLAYKGKNRGLFEDITVEEARWLADLLNQLSDKQIEDAFRAANYSPEEIKTLLLAVKGRISDLNQATKSTQAGM
ncbi:MAG TPA: hypothetical protein VK400_15080 [Pyrinomonadaceae bacterium]|nr:hypothetical protein [Pyrinomonadaceae bacterium]